MTLYSLYTLWSELSDKIYFGITTNPEERLKQHRRVKSRDKRGAWISRYGHSVNLTILSENLSKIEACEFEKFFISWARANFGSDRVVNTSDGGDTPPSQKGRKRSEATKQKVSKANKGKAYRKNCLHNEESKQFMSNQNKSKIGVIAINLKTGERSVFSSQKEATRKLSLGKTDVSSVLHGRQRTAKGYLFEVVMQK